MNGIITSRGFKMKLIDNLISITLAIVLIPFAIVGLTYAFYTVIKEDSK